MKKLIIIIVGLLLINTAFADAYEDYLKEVQKQLAQMGTKIDANNPNPFITGTALSNYFMNEKILLLERDAYFMMKANKLTTTEEVADYQHRLKVLTSHANNILLQLVRALQNASQEGMAVEAPKHQMEWEQLVEECKKDPACIEHKLESGEVVLRNDLIDSFALSTQIFKEIPYMHSIEFASMFQLVQLLYMESILGHAKIARVEFDLFLKKQKALVKIVDQNTQMTAKEKEFNRALIVNTVNKWKKTILNRRFDQKEQYKAAALKLQKENQDIIAELKTMRKDTPDILPEVEICKRFLRINKDSKRCELRAKVEDRIGVIEKSQPTFLNAKEKKIPAEFFENI
ncbi:MAG: hypothetical protein ACJ76H_01295 [Bacteriovoracaceae bacterium]